MSNVPELNITFGIKNQTPDDLQAMLDEVEQVNEDAYGVFLKVRSMLDTIYMTGDQWMIWIALAQILEKQQLEAANGNEESSEESSQKGGQESSNEEARQAAN